MTMILNPRIVLTGAAAIFAFGLMGCGGNVSGDAGSSGGYTAAGGTASVMGGISSTSNGGASICCHSVAICDVGDQQISNTATCPPGVQCYSREMCCSRIQCVHSVTYQDSGVGGSIAFGAGGSCTAYPACDAGDVQFYGTCPPYTYCYSRSACNVAISCLHQGDAGIAPPFGSGGQCNVFPSCPAGERIFGACPGTGCYAVTMCGYTITCGFPTVDAGTPEDAGGGNDASACYGVAEYNRDYVAESASLCMAIKYACPAGTRWFSDACGCGCEQDSSCPAGVNCMPGLTAYSPLCSNSSCPYTIRLQ